MTDEYREGTYTSPNGCTLAYRLRSPCSRTHENVPLIVFLHGLGERGSDNTAQLRLGIAELTSSLVEHPCFILAPQCPADEFWVNTQYCARYHCMAPRPTFALECVQELIDQTSARFPVDPLRVYLTGLSMGGFGCFELLSRAPQLFAAAFIVCGGGDCAQAPCFSSVPLWLVHGAQDEAVLPQRSRDMIGALREQGANVRYTEYPNTGHDAWTAGYQEVDLGSWLLSQRRTAVVSPPLCPHQEEHPAC